MLPIVEITQENPYVKTFWFDFSLQSKPGQFVMLWVPGVDQKPFSIAYDTGDRFGVSVFAVGTLSKALYELTTKDKVGITGPYGNPFTVKPNTRYITVAGGYGAGPLAFLAEQASAIGSRVDFCIGARNADLLLFEQRVANLPHVTTHTATNDGSKGHTGYVTDIVIQLLKQHQSQIENPQSSVSINKLPILATCGPELMEKAVLDLCNTYDVDCEISIERYMKCGFTICGQCCMDPLGIPMCSIGPVVNRETANKLTEFGMYHRDKSGISHPFSL